MGMYNMYNVPARHNDAYTLPINLQKTDNYMTALSLLNHHPIFH